MFQIDYVNDDPNNTSGGGWLAGPYFAAKHPLQPLFVDGRLLYGKTYNDISPLGTDIDSFQTGRWLVQLRAKGVYKNDYISILPLLNFTYTDDTQDTYVDSLGNTIPDQTISLFQFEAGTDFRKPILIEFGDLYLRGGMSGIFSQTIGGVANYEGMRGRIELGIDYKFEKGGSLKTSGFYDGIGSDFEGYGMGLRFDLKF